MRKHHSTTARARLFLLHGGRCHFCGHKIDGIKERWELSHEIPLAIGGADDDANTKPAHYRCHRAATAAVDQPRIAKTKRQKAGHIGAKRSSRPFPGGKGSAWKRKIDGTVERRT